jgi:peptidoglycan/LPS O-acetylase OafA/YrhL
MPGGIVATHLSLIGRRNNFDLLRLLAALQVVYFHGLSHLQVDVVSPVGIVVNKLLSFFPGVPIFFVISGFLVSLAYERAPSIATYGRNRVLRVYPGLWVCVAASLGLLIASGALTGSMISSPTFYGWIIGQLTVGQFYNPDVLRHFGVGVLNGSLWTIPIEVQFYLLIPLIYRLCLRRESGWVGAMTLGVLALLSYWLWYVLQSHAHIETTNVWYKVLGVTLLPYLFMFILGLFIQRNLWRLVTILNGRALFWLAAYISIRVVMQTSPVATVSMAGTISLVGSAVSFIVLAMFVVSFALTWRSTSERLLDGNDLSYGVYLYHMLVVNALVHIDWLHRPIYLAVTVVVTVGLAATSWWWVERPALRLKRPTIRPQTIQQVCQSTS